MRFTKIKYDLKEVLLKWTTERGSETHEHELTSGAQPHPDLAAALKALRRDVIMVCELDPHYETDLRVQSVTFSTSEKTGASGAVVTGLKKLAIASSPLVLNTPYLLEAGEQDTGIMSDGMRRRLDTLREEAEAYINGKRSQGELFTPSKAEERATDDALDEMSATISVNGSEPVPFTKGAVDRAFRQVGRDRAAGKDE